MIALIGFGEVGQTLASDLRETGNGRELVAWDTAFADRAGAPLAAANSGLAKAAASSREALAGAGFVISAVTAAQCVEAATEAARHLWRNAWYLDLNSVSPGTRTLAATAIERAGGRYVEAAVMAPISPKRIATPMLLGGPHAAAFEPVAHSLGFIGARPFSVRLGDASAAKMCRSVLVKGIEALLGESIAAARHYGVEGTVLASLGDLFPGLDWPAKSAYMISRSVLHGLRRAEEMREAAQTVREAGLEPHMCLATAQRQEWAAGRTSLLKEPGDRGC